MGEDTMRITRFLTASIMIIFLVACGNSDLSRSKAQSLIQVNEDFSKPQMTVKLSSGARNKGESQGFWDDKGKLTPKGRDTFVSFRWSRATVRKTLSREVTYVTGIANAVTPFGGAPGDVKEVQYQWEYNNLKGPARRFIVRGGTGVALMRLYDDGWRIEEISIKEGTQGFVLSPAEKAEADKDRRAELERKRAEQERLAQEAERKRREKEKRDRLIAESKKVKRTIGSFTCLDSFRGKNRSGRTISLTDVSVNHSCRTREDIWYGDIDEHIRTKCKQTAMGWTKPCVIINPGRTWLVFDSRTKRDSFFKALDLAISKWRSSYPELQ